MITCVKVHGAQMNEHGKTSSLLLVPPFSSQLRLCLKCPLPTIFLHFRPIACKAQCSGICRGLERMLVSGIHHEPLMLGETVLLNMNWRRDACWRRSLWEKRAPGRCKGGPWLTTVCFQWHNEAYARCRAAVVQYICLKEAVSGAGDDTRPWDLGVAV